MLWAEIVAGDNNGVAVVLAAETLTLNEQGNVNLALHATERNLFYCNPVYCL